MKQTTDECYTPEPVYTAVAQWVREKTGLAGDFARPFYPGGDYENFDYTSYAAVVDNPPFSIVTKITGFYASKRIPFFLFAPGLSALRAAQHEGCCAIYTEGRMIYENGLGVRTAFVSNLFPGAKAMTAPDLDDAINRAIGKEKKPPRVYPDNYLRQTDLLRLAAAGIECKVTDGKFVDSLDNGPRNFGGGLLIGSKDAAALKKACAKCIPLSERELAICREIDDKTRKRCFDLRRAS